MARPHGCEDVRRMRDHHEWCMRHGNGTPSKGDNCIGLPSAGGEQ